MQAFAFYLFATIVIVSGALTIGSRNPVHSVLWLIMAFFNAAGLMLILGAEFIAMLLVIVYVGAVAVLFLFVVMMLDVDFAELRSGIAKYWPLGATLALALLAEVCFALFRSLQPGGVTGRMDTATPGQVPNIEALGALLYTRYLYIFEAAGLVLLVAMIGAIVLSHRTRRDVRQQKVSQQVRRRPEDAVRIVKGQPIGEGVEL